MRRIDEIILHCSATPKGRDFRAKDIDAWHKARGFKRIGYHYVVTLDGTVERGRPDEEIGAHCTGRNVNSIGVCYIGGVGLDGKPEDTRTVEQRRALERLVAELKEKYSGATVHGHNEFARKACPSFNVKNEFL